MKSYFRYRVPEVAPQWRSAFRDYQRPLTRQYTMVTAWVVLIMIPLFQASDWWIDSEVHSLWLYHFLIRLPPALG